MNTNLWKTVASGQATVVVVCAAIVSFTAVALNGPGAPLSGDAPEYLSIAQSLAQGHGYMAPLSPWPTQPALGRAPIWPIVNAAVLRVLPAAEPHALLRYTTAVVNTFVCLSIFILTFQITNERNLSMISGIAASLYPVSLFLTVSGACEVLALLLMVSAFIAVITRGVGLYIGSLLFGILVLVRTNFVIFPACAVFALFFFKRDLTKVRLRRVIAGMLLFAAPSLVWCVRNYRISGRFPLLSTIEGETLYGSNNAVVASNTIEWGYWIMPDQIPSERRLRDLARTMSEIQVNDYYHGQAVSFLRSNWADIPKLILGKLIRGFVPIPFRPRLASYLVFGCRAILYAALLWSLASSWHLIDPIYRWLCSSALLVTLATTIIYYGNYRFTYLVELLALPFIALAAKTSRPLLVQNKWQGGSAAAVSDNNDLRFFTSHT